MKVIEEMVRRVETRKWSILILLLCIVISMMNTNRSSQPPRRSSSSAESAVLPASPSSAIFDQPSFLTFDFYRQSCPLAEEIIRSKVHHLSTSRSDVGPALLRLLFHDCFVQGCDASLLLDHDGTVNGSSEKEAPPNESVKGFDLIDIIKSELELRCPGIVSCADIVVLAAREGLLLGGGPFYPLVTGRRDGTTSMAELATQELPSPQDHLDRTLASFASKGFTQRETVCLLGAHNIGSIHCKFIKTRLNNFQGTREADPTMEAKFQERMRKKCEGNHTAAMAAEERGKGGRVAIQVDDGGEEKEEDDRDRGFGTAYYRRILKGRGILYTDQQLLAQEGTAFWVREYASNAALFRQDFSAAMAKLSNLNLLPPPMGQVRLNCSKLFPG